MNEPRPVPWRALLLGALILPPFTYFGMVAYVVVQTATWMADSLLRGPLFLLFLLTLSSLALRRIGSRLGLSQRELLIVFAMVSLGTAMCGTGWAMFVVPTMAGAPVFYAEAFPAWAAWVDWIPTWFMVQDREIIDALHLGHADLYTRQALLALLPPLLTWSAFMVLLVMAQHALAQIVARPWIERERLTFPLTMLPIEMTRVERPAFWRNGGMWAGFALAAFIVTHNSIAYLYPAVPTIPVKLIQWPAPVDRPWLGLGSIWTAMYPFMIGIGFLLPLDVSLSVWFFFLFSRFTDVGAVMLGFRDRGGFSPMLPPYHGPQNTGAVLMLAVVLLWRVRGDIVGGLRGARRGNSAALTALVVSFVGVLWLTHNAQIPGTVVAIWFALYLLVALVMGRLVAETGMPTAMWPMSPQEILFALGGQPMLNARQLTAFNWLRNFDERYADNAIMHQLTGLRLYEEVDRRWGPMHLALAIAAVVGIAGGLWALLHLYFTYGLASATTRSWPTVAVAQGPFKFLQSLFDNPRQIEPAIAGGMAAGAGIMALLIALRARFVGFPLHPIGYAISANWAMMEQWFPFLVAWVLKLTILRLGGMRLYRRALPFFLGLILGDLVVPVIWAIIGVATGQQMWLAFPH